MNHVDTIVLVEDINQSKTFYTEVIGLEILHDWGNMIVFKDRFALHQADRLLPESEAAQFCQQGKQGRGNVIIYVETDNLEATYTDLQQQGIEILHGIVQLPWQKIFRITDPDGHIIEIGEPFQT